MEPRFWIDKWKKQETGFHLASAHPLLRKYFPKVFANQTSVFLPLCGKTQDLIFCSDQGLAVIGNELSEVAIEQFFLANQLAPKTEVSQNFILREANNIAIYQGDFFELEKRTFENTQAIYDRAALVALPVEMRKSYAEKMKQLFPQATMLLITLEYNQREMSGPPFSVTQDEVNSLFDFANIELLYKQNIIDKEPKFKARGLSFFNECAYHIQWKQ
ncbi:MAG: thiopurine S-methyltransferase [Kangiellaceae bacterium]|nr:thiopurine S-methyltransferase [Kangiellaceae bacterium]MCW9001036.1 thiopurine S-methyltransferase [Kangiellaceae bacterium]